MNKIPFEIEVSGGYNAKFTVMGKATAVWAVGAAKARKDVDLIKVSSSGRMASFRRDNDSWVQVENK